MSDDIDKIVAAQQGARRGTPEYLFGAAETRASIAAWLREQGEIGEWFAAKIERGEDLPKEGGK